MPPARLIESSLIVAGTLIGFRAVALSDEQNAMLRLLASGEQGYGDIAALLGLSEDEVRAKVVGALAQLQAEGKPAPDIPPPLPGGAQPAAEVTAPEPEPVAEVPAQEETAEPAIADAVAPAPESGSGVAKRPPAEPKTAAADAPAAPRAPAAASRPAASRPPSDRHPSGGRTITLPTGRRAWYWGGGIVAAIVVIVVVILLASGGGGGSSSTTSTGAAANTPAEETATGEGTPGESAAETNGAGKPATEAELAAVDGSEATGRAAFGRVKNKLALQIEAADLEPTTSTDSYAIWLAQSPKRMLPLASTSVKASGKGAGTIAAEFEVPVEILAYLAGGTFDQITVTRVQNDEFKTSIEAATKEKKPPAYTGEPILSGSIKGPIVGLAKREEEQQKGE
jgi:DNA-binding CsgD family transcriptional regulator